MDHHFPEESPIFSPSEGGGYYPAEIHQKLNDDKYKVIRKIGYGPRSPTWLVLRSDNRAYFVVKVFTVTASDRAKTVEIPILKTVNNLNPSKIFWVKGSAASHLCFVMNPVSTSISSTRCRKPAVPRSCGPADRLGCYKITNVLSLSSTWKLHHPFGRSRKSSLSYHSL